MSPFYEAINCWNQNPIQFIIYVMSVLIARGTHVQQTVIFITIINIYRGPLLCDKCHGALQEMNAKEAHILQIPFITPWQSQISHSLPVPDHVTVLLSPSPLRRYRLGVWELAPSSAGRRDTCSLAGMGVWNSFQESDRHVTCWCSGSDMPQISRHASVKTHVAGLSLCVLKPSDPLLHSVQVVSTLWEPI